MSQLSLIWISNHADTLGMPLFFMITDKYYDGRISPSINNVIRNRFPLQLRTSNLTFSKSGLKWHTKKAVIALFTIILYYCTYGLFFVPRPTILYIKKKWKLVKVFNSMTRSVCVNYNVFGLCIPHDANLVLSGSHHQDTLLKNTHYISKIDYSLVKRSQINTIFFLIS